MQLLDHENILKVFQTGTIYAEEEDDEDEDGEAELSEGDGVDEGRKDEEEEFKQP